MPYGRRSSWTVSSGRVWRWLWSSCCGTNPLPACCPGRAAAAGRNVSSCPGQRWTGTWNRRTSEEDRQSDAKPLFNHWLSAYTNTHSTFTAVVSPSHTTVCRVNSRRLSGSDTTGSRSHKPSTAAAFTAPLTISLHNKTTFRSRFEPKPGLNLEATWNLQSLNQRPLEIRWQTPKHTWTSAWRSSVKEWNGGEQLSSCEILMGLWPTVTEHSGSEFVHTNMEIILLNVPVHATFLLHNISGHSGRDGGHLHFLKYCFRYSLQALVLYYNYLITKVNK